MRIYTVHTFNCAGAPLQSYNTDCIRDAVAAVDNPPSGADVGQTYIEKWNTSESYVLDSLYKWVKVNLPLIAHTAKLIAEGE